MSAAETRQQQIRQAQADLEEIAADALEDLREVEPDALLQVPNPDHGRNAPGARSVTLAVDEVRLRINLWDQGAYDAVAGDTVLLAGSVNITKRRYDTELNAANVVYEQVGDCLAQRDDRFLPDMHRWIDHEAATPLAEKS